MRYVIVSKVNGDAGYFNDNLRKKVLEIFNAKSSKLPAHLTIKSPFEADDISDLENILEKFVNSNQKEKYLIKGYDHFEDRVIFMKVYMSKEAQLVHDKLIDTLNNINYVNFTSIDGKNKIFHVTITSKKIQNIFTDIWNYVTSFPCEFTCLFDNISIYRWENNTWNLHKEYLLK